MSRPRGPHRPEPPDDVFFPVVPMLDMAFQLMAFFVLTFQAPSRETRLDLYLPAAPVALPAERRVAAGTAAYRAAQDLETDLVVRAEADDDGGLRQLRLGEAPVADTLTLEATLRRYAGLLEGKPLRVVLLADDRLKYDVAADLIGSCSAAGADSIRLADPQARPGAARP